MKKVLKWIFIVIAALFILGLVISKDDKQKVTTQTQSSISNNSDKAESAAKIEEETKSSNWSYSEDIDKMTSEKKKFASCTSTNQINFDFPYNGGSTFTLTARKKSNTTDLYLSVDKGQFIAGVSDGEIKMKFDNEKPMTVGVSGASDGSGDIIFINSAKRILSKLKSAKKLMVEAEFFQAGNKVIEFDVEGLNWN